MKLTIKKNVKKKLKNHDPDFFAYAKKTLGKKRFDRAIRKGQEKAQELSDKKDQITDYEKK